ncbi:unnamed protein product [Clonostachys byssicola]|uniref:Uncharacterized protein n=1 Tax=Clonostachys byssicola TaxID=160290 RepID=A0A9N9Y5P0_9HYPO|nr:unnamed protein product [Clonostachys byssicola]
MVDLELMYNFTTFTFATLSDDPSLRQMLKTTAVKMAMDNDCLMRMILAVSALHLAHYRPSKRAHYLQRGLEHHAAANRKAISLLTDLRQEDCEALHLFSVLTLFFALGCPREEQSSFILGESVVPNWLALVRGTEPIIEILDPSTYKGPLAPLFEYGRNAWRKLYGSEQPRNPALLMELQDQVTRACKDKEALPIYLATIDHLRHILGMIIPSARIGGADWNGGSLDGYHTTAASARPSPQGPRLEPWDILVLTWHMVDFLSLLQVARPEQEALSIFAHMLIIFKKLESQWWLEGWATHVMERVWGLLDDEHKLWTQWPIEELGWVPP